MDVVQYACLLLFLLSTSNLLSSEALFMSNDTDRAALLQFKAAIGSSSSGSDHVLSSWNETTHFCNWEGITCGHRHQRVRLIDLHGLGLEGTISPYLGNLSFLRGINLNHNKFHGQIPPQLGLLHRLEDLNLSYNSLAGKIPINISHCSNLRILNLDRNQLLEGPIHAQLTTFPKLLVMNLSFNNFKGTIPPSIGNLSTLRYLNLVYNNLAGQIPHSLGRIKGLRFIALSENSLSGKIPHSIYNLSFLEVISLIQNQLQGNLPMNMGLALRNLEFFAASNNRLVGSIPVSLSNASRLQTLYISGNRFSGKVPQNIGSMRYLKNLMLADNDLEDDDHLNILDSLANCSELAYLSLYENSFTGRVSSISNLSKLVGLDLSTNRFYGDLPTDISNLVGLQDLSIQENLLTGNIPPSIGMLSELVSLCLSMNSLRGKIPHSICNGSNLLQLYLADNKLEGQIPSSIGKCNKLLTLQISKNNFNGSIPKALFTISSLSIFLDISDNFLNGTLPTEISNLKNLGVLYAVNNSLSGEIPRSLGSCTSLEGLHLQGNFFQGIIPESLANVKNLQEIDLSQNNLSGPIPIFLGELKSLQFLNLSFNNLKGNVPDKGVFQNESGLDLTGNKLLCGGPILLHLQACPTEIHEKKRSKVLHVIIPLLCCSFVLISLLCFTGVCYWRRKLRKEQPSTPILGEKYPKFTYQNLMKATNGFSSESLVGAGRYGTVYKGVLEEEGTVVAIKVINLQLHGAAKTFNAECKALKNIKHRNLVKVITSCPSIDHRGNDFKALVFEFIPNGSLESWLYKSHNPEQTLEHLNLVQRLNVAIDVASALDYLHNQCHDSIIHCDLKASNILIDDEMVAHVGDFGLAKFVNVSSNNPSQGGSSSMAIKGTIGYVPPEYGIGGEISTSGDVYSYGVVLLELFIGKRPTDEVSLKGLSIHEYVKHAFPRQVADKVDPKIFPGEVHNYGATRDCLVMILQVGIACTMMSPHERPTIKAVLNDVHAVRTSFLG